MLSLNKGQLFHGRYLLVKALGRGASAEVWLAKDTKAGNLLVALKIFSSSRGLDTFGKQNFQREFTNVYDMKHSYLLPPTGYDICDGNPYLIMQYCENGSCMSMAGRIEEADLLKLLHDVAAGLEYLHLHNIIHQDIKPDNILLDDQCNFLVTDFGISVSSETGSDGTASGTRAYMGPERFRGTTVAASDMWSLGATAVELLTGNPPYGMHGGLLQTQGETLPELPDSLQPEVKEMIASSLDPDPGRRISPADMKRKIETYWETGKWTRPSNLKTIVYIATAAACILVCLGIFFWDYTRTKVYYYKDYAEYWAEPHGIGRLSANDVAHREMSYRFEYSKGKLRRMSLVNSKGGIIDHTDTEHMASRFSDVRYFYTDDGKVDFTVVADRSGKVLFKLDYDEGLKTATFRHNDEYGTEKNLDANTNDLYKRPQWQENKSRISRYLLTFDDNGLLTERRYAGLQNIPAPDRHNIYGSRFKYDDKGRKIEEAFIGLDGEIVSNNDGMAIRQFTYDDNDNWRSVTYLNPDGLPSHDGSSCAVVKLDYDKYGNRIRETYFDIEDNPAIRTDRGVSGFEYEIDSDGFRVKSVCLGTDGKPTFSLSGFVETRWEYDENGYQNKESYLDDKGKPTLYAYDRVGDTFNSLYSAIETVNDSKGQMIRITYLDEEGNPMEQASGIASVTFEYDEAGNTTNLKYFDAEGKPVGFNGYNEQTTYEYDERNNMVKVSYLDAFGNPSTSEDLVSVEVLEYNPQGDRTKIEALGKDGKPVNYHHTTYSSWTMTYDEAGNLKQERYFDKNGQPAIGPTGYSRLDVEYDSKTNLPLRQTYSDTYGHVILSNNYRYDAKGNNTMFYTLGPDGALRPGTAVKNYTYDNGRKVTASWTSDVTGHPVNNPETPTYCMEKYVYDSYGNTLERTFWSYDGTPAVTNEDYATHKRLNTYDSHNRVIRELNYGIDGKPLSGAGVNPEGRVKYDQWGNIVELACYDGYGNPKIGAGGFFKTTGKFDRYGRLLVQEFFDTSMQPTISLATGFSKQETSYNKFGDIVEVKNYLPSGLYSVLQSTYNDKRNITEQRLLDGNGHLMEGISRMVVAYDPTGTTPRLRRYYFGDGTLAYTQTWNPELKIWNAPN